MPLGSEPEGRRYIPSPPLPTFSFSFSVFLSTSVVRPQNHTLFYMDMDRRRLDGYPSPSEACGDRLILQLSGLVNILAIQKLSETMHEFHKMKKNKKELCGGSV